MDLSIDDRATELAATAATAFTEGTIPPASRSFTDVCIVARESGRAASDMGYVTLAVARMFGWRGGPDVAIAIDPVDGRCPHVALAGRASTAIVIDRSGTVAMLDLSTATRTPQPTIDDPDACLVEFDTESLTDAPTSEVGRVLELATILHVAEAVGAAEGALRATIDRCTERPVGDGVLADRQVVRHACVDMTIDTTIAWDAVLDAAAIVDRGGDSDAIAIAASTAKVLGVERSRRVAMESLRLAGGIGILDTEPWHRWYRRTKAAEPVLGRASEHRARIARAAFASRAVQRDARS